MKITQSESAIQTSIIHFLQYSGWYCLRLNSGAIRTQKNKLVRLSPAGTPDIMAFKAFVFPSTGNPALSKLLFIEVKRPGNKPTPLQLAKMEELRGYGARCIVATSILDVEKYI